VCDRRPETQKISLATLVAQLRESCRASARLYGGTTYYTEELALFKEAAESLNLFLDSPPPELALPPTAEGNEHQVWFRESRATFLKATWADHFGMKVVYRSDEEPQASPIDYLERWHLHNQLFGDSVVFLGAIEDDNKLRLLIEQPAIEGTVATLEEIESFFTTSGWLPFRVEGNLAFFDPDRELTVSDTHLGNIIVMPDGQLAPIDLRVQHLTSALADIVRSHCGQTLNNLQT
jgi:hypothetical protein